MIQNYLLGHCPLFILFRLFWFCFFPTILTNIFVSLLVVYWRLQVEVRSTWLTFLVCQLYLKDLGKVYLCLKQSIYCRVKYSIYINLNIKTLLFRSSLPFMKVAIHPSRFFCEINLRMREYSLRNAKFLEGIFRKHFKDMQLLI